MRKKLRFFTLVLVPSSHGKVRRLRIPRSLITLSVIGFILCFFILFYFVSEYTIIKERLAYFENLGKERLAYFENLEELTQVQEEKIASLAEKVDQFNETLNKLRATEDRLKIMAGAGAPDADSKKGGGEGGPDEYTSFEEWVPENIKTDSLQTIEAIENGFQILKNRAKLQERDFAQIEEVIQEQKLLFACTPNIFPIKGWISSGYGPRRNPFTHKREMHEAVDIVAPWGTPVKAACQGKVLYTGWKDFYGLVLRVTNDHGYSTLYAHLSKVLVKKGEWVEKGQIIGKIGSSGRSTGPHLHFEVWKEGKTIDPLTLMVDSVS